MFGLDRFNGIPKSIYIYINSSISNNSVHFCLDTLKCKNSSISNNSVSQKYTIYMSKIVLFKTIGFIVRGATTLGQSKPGSDGNEGVLRIPQSFCITGSSPFDCLVSFTGHSSPRSRHTKELKNGT